MTPGCVHSFADSLHISEALTKQSRYFDTSHLPLFPHDDHVTYEDVLQMTVLKDLLAALPKIRTNCSRCVPLLTQKNEVFKLATAWMRGEKKACSIAIIDSWNDRPIGDMIHDDPFPAEADQVVAAPFPEWRLHFANGKFVMQCSDPSALIQTRAPSEVRDSFLYNPLSPFEPDQRTTLSTTPSDCPNREETTRWTRKHSRFASEWEALGYTIRK